MTGLFDSLTDAVENSLNVVSGVADGLSGGELPSKRQVAQLLADGMTLAAAAEVYGVGLEVLEELMKEEAAE